MGGRPGSGRRPPAGGTGGERQAPQEGRGEDTVSWGGAARGRRASVLEFCLVFCTVSGLAQSSLWSRDFALDSLSYLAPTVRLWTRGAGTDRRPAAPAGVQCEWLRWRPAAWHRSPLGKCVLCVFRAGREAVGRPRRARGPGPDRSPARRDGAGSSPARPPQL